ncbi:MAG: PD-(D/E)XK nuclease family protein [DPANN group archaeon]|nr:PD-(D/E)XK nuclease family protein [DPANN group archaeon]
MDSDKSLKYNIFNYATKELSQDAFIAWLLNYYNDKDHELYPIAEKLLNKIVTESHIDSKLPKTKIDIRLQEDKRDVTVYFLDDKGEPIKELVIFFEDKVNSSEGDGQITGYFNKLRDKDFNKVIPVYFKTTYMTKKEEASLNTLKTKLNSLVIFSQKEISDFFVNHLNQKDNIDIIMPIRTYNVLLNDWITYFKSMAVFGIDVKGITNISEKLKEKDSSIYKKSLKIKILDEIGNSIKTSQNLSKLDNYNVGPFNNSHAIYYWIELPDKKTYIQIYIMGDTLIRLSFNQNPAENFDEIRNKIEVFCNAPNNWKYARYKKKRASFKFDLNIETLECTYSDLKEQIKKAILEVSNNTDLM